CGVMANFHPRLYVWLVHHFQSDPEKAALAADLCSMTAFTESLAYPITAKYHLNELAGVPMTLYTNARPAADFTPYHAMCVRQMDALVTEALRQLEA
ncbi:MAG: dihydrodipicolinate synthase family protein, partial [Clostridia bacterium]|nr:dihydrodipicolinate synthase family protein [Clostridia bacterium]